MIFLRHFSVFEFLIRFSTVVTQWPNLLCRIFSNAAHSVRMWIAVSSSFWSSQNSQLGSSASFDLNACFFEVVVAS